MRKAATVAGAIVVSIQCSVVLGTGYAEGRPVVRVDGTVVDPTPPLQGGDWGDGGAYKYIDDAILRAIAAQQSNPGVINLWVAATPAGDPYEPDESLASPSGSGLRTASFAFSQTRENIHMYGGFAGNESQFQDRDWRANETVLSGDLNNDDVPGGNRGDNSHQLVTMDIAANVRINGFTITAANADNGLSGGGLNSGGSSGVLANCTFTDNFAQSGGAVAIVPGSSGALALHVTNCVFSGNTAVEYGGGLYIAGVWDQFDLLIDIVNCAFDHNTVTGLILEPVEEDLWEAGLGGSLYLGKGFVFGPEGNPINALVTNCTIADSTAIVRGTCTSVCGEGGGAYVAVLTSTGQVAEFVNTIVWGNEDTVSGTGEGAQIAAAGGFVDRVAVEYSDIEGGWTGAGSNNIDDDPQFALGGYRLTAGSPCIDAGSNMRAPVDEFDVDDDGDLTEPTPDLDLAERIRQGSVNPVIDMGAYEFKPCPADLNGDGSVGFADLTQLLNAWGPCPGCPEDLNNDDSVGFADLTMLLNAWGPCQGGSAASAPDPNGPAAAGAMSVLVLQTAQGQLTPEQFEIVVQALAAQ